MEEEKKKNELQKQNSGKHPRRSSTFNFTPELFYSFGNPIGSKTEDDENYQSKEMSIAATAELFYIHKQTMKMIPITNDTFEVIIDSGCTNALQIQQDLAEKIPSLEKLNIQEKGQIK